MPRPKFVVFAVAGLVVTAAATVQAQSQPAFVAPPRTIADITAILDQEKPDAQRTAKLRAAAEANPSGGSGSAEFFYNRCQARANLGDVARALADCEKAVAIGRTSLGAREIGRLRQGLAIQYSVNGDPKKSLAVLFELIRNTNVK